MLGRTWLARSALAAVCTALCLLPATPAGATGWRLTGAMVDGAENPSANVLPDGEVLVAGGSRMGGASSNEIPGTIGGAERYDPTTGRWSATGAMQEGRILHTGTTLASGRVLVAGGQSRAGKLLSSAEVYDPNSGTWEATGSMHIARAGQTATLLGSGKVLVAGGSFPVTAEAELYDPSTGTWSVTAPMHSARAFASAVLLSSGEVLLAGGETGQGHSLASAELYDAASETWSETGAMRTPRVGYVWSLAKLASGQVLMDGGVDNGVVSASAEVYDPNTGTWTATAPMQAPRWGQSSTTLPTGEVLVAGGTLHSPSAELYEPGEEGWVPVAGMLDARCEHTATLLYSGEVLVAGGDPCSPEQSLPVGEVFGTPAPAPTPGALPGITELAATPPLSLPGAITSGPLGELWFTDEFGNRIGSLRPGDGQIGEYAANPSLDMPYAIATGPEGDLWFSDQLNDALGRLNPADAVAPVLGAETRTSPAAPTAPVPVPAPASAAAASPVNVPPFGGIFKLAHVRVLAGGALRLTFVLPARGRLSVRGMLGRRRGIVYASAHTSTALPRTLTLTLLPSRHALTALRRLHEVHVHLAATFTQPGVRSTTQTDTFSVRYRRVLRTRRLLRAPMGSR